MLKKKQTPPKKSLTQSSVCDDNILQETLKKKAKRNSKLHTLLKEIVDKLF